MESDIPSEKRFKVLCDISRAQHFLLAQSRFGTRAGLESTADGGGEGNSNSINLRMSHEAAACNIAASRSGGFCAGIRLRPVIPRAHPHEDLHFE